MTWRFEQSNAWGSWSRWGTWYYQDDHGAFGLARKVHGARPGNKDSFEWRVQVGELPTIYFEAKGKTRSIEAARMEFVLALGIYRRNVSERTDRVVLSLAKEFNWPKAFR